MSFASRRSRSHSTLASPTNQSSKRSLSSATSSRTMMLNRGKRARKDSSSPSQLHSVIIPVTSASATLGPSTAKPLVSVPTNLTSSSPSAPPFPSTSAAFFFSGHQSGFHVQRDPLVNSVQLLSPSPKPDLDDLHREAFTSLRKSVAESGEGFVRRMREWEQRRHVDSSKSSNLGTDREREKRRDRGRGRIARNNHMDQRLTVNDPTANPYVEICQSSSYLRRGPDIGGRDPHFGTQEETDVESDILLGGSPRAAFNAEQHPRKRKAISLSDAMDVIDSPELFDVEIASDEEFYPDSRCTTLECSFTCSNARSSSPFSFINTSDDESSYDQTHSGFSSPRGIHNSVDWSNDANPVQGNSGFRCLQGVELDGLDPSPPSTSANYLNSRHFLSRPHSVSSQITPTPNTGNSRISRHKLPQTTSEKAVAALALALANGSGSLADYRSVREAQGELQELEAGALWD